MFHACRSHASCGLFFGYELQPQWLSTNNEWGPSALQNDLHLFRGRRERPTPGDERGVKSSILHFPHTLLRAGCASCALTWLRWDRSRFISRDCGGHEHKCPLLLIWKTDIHISRRVHWAKTTCQHMRRLYYP